MTKQKLKPQYSELITATEIQLLHAEYDSLYPTAAKVAEKILGITDPYRVNEMISNGQFPIPVFKLGDSQKSKWLVKLTELAIFLQNKEAV
jgi:hypothetical protein